MVEIPKVQTAVVADGKGGLYVDNAAPVPSLPDDLIMIKTAAVALNPVDSKTRAPPFATPGCRCGTDWAGTVVAQGSGARTVHREPLRPGDRVFGVVHGMHSITPQVGAFAQYVSAVSHLVLRVPEHLSLEEAASMGTGITTVGLALFCSLKVPGSLEAPVEKKTNILIYGGSSATGTMAIQIAKL